jgi:hypothetical protein
MIFRGELVCRQSCCGHHQWAKAIEFVSAKTEEDARQQLHSAFADAWKRRCGECRRPISIKHLKIIPMDNNGNDLEVEELAA